MGILREALNPSPAALQEAAQGPPRDRDEHLYRRMSAGSRRELQPYMQEEALRRAWLLHERNPLAHGSIEVVKDHIVGDGFKVVADDPEVQAVLDRHWNDPVNQWDLRQHDKVRELCLFGEQLYVAFTNRANGHVRLASIDPLNVRDVWCNPENPDEPWAVVVNERLGAASGGGGVGWQGDKVYRVIHVDEDPDSETYGYLVGAKRGESGEIEETYTRPSGQVERPYDGDCFWFTINRVTGTKRGRSDILSSLDWYEVMDSILFNFADRTQLMNAFIWDVTIDQATPAQIQEWLKEWGAPPKAATVRAHNEKEHWEAVSPTFHSEDFEVQHKTTKAHTLASLGLPPHWFGDQEANRATALEMGSPTLKRLKSRQLYVIFMIEIIMRYQLHQAEIFKALGPPPAEAGAKLPADEKPQHEFRVLVPEMSVRDMEQAAVSFMNVVQALVLALSEDLIDIEEAQRILVLAAELLGAEVDLEAMQERIAEQPPEPEPEIILPPALPGQVPGQEQPLEEGQRSNPYMKALHRLLALNTNIYFTR